MKGSFQMALLWLNLIIVFLLSFFSRYAATPLMESGSPVEIRPNKLLVTGALMALVCISGLRSNIGDTLAYIDIYTSNDFTWQYVMSQKDIGFGLFQMQLKNLSQDPQLLIFSTALITNVLVVTVLYKYSRMLDLSLYVYITGGLFLVSMNGIRQMLAAAIIFTATKLLIEGRWKGYFLVVICASFFHQSAFILLPLYFVVRTKAWSKSTVALVLLAVTAVIGFDQFINILFSAIENTQYAEYKNFDEGGANFLRVLINAIPLVIAYLGRERLRELFPESDYIVNMTLLGFVFMIVSTQNWIFARFTIYFGLYQLILISWLVKLFREKDQKVVYYGILAFYFVYFYYEHVVTLNIIYKSDFLNWF